MQEFQKLSMGDRTITLTIENTGYNTKKVDILASKFPKSIKVQYHENKSAVARILYHGVDVSGCRMIVKSVFGPFDQFIRALLLVEKTANGSLISRPVRPISFKSAYQNCPDQVDMIDLEFPLNNSNTLMVKILPKTSITLVFKINS